MGRDGAGARRRRGARRPAGPGPDGPDLRGGPAPGARGGEPREPGRVAAAARGEREAGSRPGHPARQPRLQLRRAARSVPGDPEAPAALGPRRGPAGGPGRGAAVPPWAKLRGGAGSSMSRTSTLRLRRATALLAIVWALSAILPSFGALHVPDDALDHPFRESRLGRVAVVHDVHPSAAAAGVAVGDHVLELNGQPFLPLAHRSRGALRPGVVN